MSSGKPPPRTFASLDRASLESGIDKLARSIRDLKALDIKSVRDRADERLETLQRRANNVLGDLLGMSSPDYKKYTVGRLEGELDTTFGDHYSVEEVRDAIKKGIAKAVATLEEASRAMKVCLDDAAAASAQGSTPPAPTAAPTPGPTPAPTPAPTPLPTPAPTAAPTPSPTTAPTPSPTPSPTPGPTLAPTRTPTPEPLPEAAMSATTSPNSRRVLVLGSGDAAVHAIELLSQLGLEPAILDAPSIERLDAVRDAGFAVVVAGEGGGGDAMMVAVGFMLALLGRSRIALLGGAPPAALDGAIKVALDDDGFWKLLLARELKRAGLDVDLNKAM